MTTAELTRSLSLRIGRIDRVWIAIALVFAALALLAPAQVPESARFAVDALIHIAPYLAVSVAVAAFARASGLDHQIGRAFSGNAAQAILLAAAFGALSPFCSCGVVPIIAGLLGAGVPLAPVMAFWLASPLMDPEMFILMLPVMGLEFTVAKMVAAFSIGAVSGFATHMLVKGGAFSDALRPQLTKSCGCSGTSALKNEKIVWAFWKDRERRAAFGGEARTTGLFLLKWLALAFVIESLMVSYVPADKIATYLGGGEWWTVPAAILVGVPSYLNGYAAIPLVGGLMDLGMAPAAGLAFMIAGGITSIPASMAVFALVRGGVFTWYLALGLLGSLAAAYGFTLYLAISA
ncbi:permease [Nisaea acidiphila]|uniref:Permease n=1 Tax=Nisaea acidiphila TaxID=1862145 RepID=A0A9J7AU17_9PROT|nr:permease [Nisaea acidiphila]UUX50815.1 permease [Nisaea acidiphila]